MTLFNPQTRNESTSSRISMALHRIAQAVGHMLRERGKQAGLSPAQIQAMLFLRYARPGVRTIGGLAGRLAATYATISGVVDALEQKGLAERRPLPADHRTITLSLTEAGHTATAGLEDVLLEIETAVATLPEAEQQVLERALQVIVRRLQTAGHVKVYEMCWGCHFFRQNAHPDDPAGPHHCAFVNAPLSEKNTYLECPDFVVRETEGGDIE